MKCEYVNDQSTSDVNHYSYCSAPGEIAVGGNLFCSFHAVGVTYEEQMQLHA